MNQKDSENSKTSDERLPNDSKEEELPEEEPVIEEVTGPEIDEEEEVPDEFRVEMPERTPSELTPE